MEKPFSNSAGPASAQGGTLVGTVTVTVGPGPSDGGQGLNPPQLTVNTGPPMEVGIKFQGIPGRQYQIQRSPDMTEGSWQTIATVTAGPTGAVEFTDEDPPQPNGFYRLRKP